MNRYRMAFSTMEMDAKIPPGSPLWREFNGSFENDDYSLPAIAYMIDEGRAFTTQHANKWRAADNYICGQHLGADFDTRGVDATLADSFVAKYAALVYATPSSTQEEPRSRALFLLDSPIMQASNYVRAASALIWVFGGHADRQCKDAARFFYGSLASIPTVLGNVLPLAVVRNMIATHEQWQKMQATPPQRPAVSLPEDDGRALAGTLRFAEDAAKGQRNTSMYWAARRWAERSITQGEAETMALQAAGKNGLDDEEAKAIVRSAYRGTR